MARAEDSNEFYWDTFFVKVEDKLFCVPRHEFIQSSEVFADMFLLPSGPATHSEGQDRDHPIVLEGYKKDEFTCLLKVMYPTTKSLIPGGNLELNLKKEEWVSVLKLSTIWNMTKIRQHAIHWLSTKATLSPIEKILLARAYRVGAWLGEAVASLVTCNPTPTLEDLSTLGWETVARILWIRDKSFRNDSNTLSFRRNAVKCANCPSSLELLKYASDFKFCSCGPTGPGITSKSELSQLTYSGFATPISRTNELLVTFGQIQCSRCRENLNANNRAVIKFCKSCSSPIHDSSDVRVVTHVIMKSLEIMIEKMFGEEIKDYE